MNLLIKMQNVEREEASTLLMRVAQVAHRWWPISLSSPLCTRVRGKEKERGKKWTRRSDRDRYDNLLLNSRSKSRSSRATTEKMRRFDATKEEEEEATGGRQRDTTATHKRKEPTPIVGNKPSDVTDSPAAHIMTHAEIKETHTVRK